MVHKFQASDNYDDYDPVPYRGGYDQEAAYGSVKPADEESGYRRADFGEDDEEQKVACGNEHNPYGRGQHGRHRPGGVYGGGRDRTRPDPDEAQPDGRVETGYGRQRPGSGKPYDGGYEQELGYRRPKPSYGEDIKDEEYRQSKYGTHHGQGRASYGEEEETGEGYGGGYGRKKHEKKNDGRDNLYGFGRRRKKDDEEEDDEEGCGGRRLEKDDNEGEEEERHGHRHHKKKHDDEEEEEEEEEGYGRRHRKKKDEEEEDDDREGYGGRRHNKKDPDDEDSDESDGGRHRKKKHDDDDDDSEEEGYRSRYRSRRGQEEKRKPYC